MGRTEFREEVKRRMYILGYTRKDLAEKADVPASTVDMVIDGRVLPSARTSDALAKALEMSPRDFRSMAYEAQQSA
jgi:transcriptional regulator with XRE-family HTH domain